MGQKCRVYYILYHSSTIIILNFNVLQFCYWIQRLSKSINFCTAFLAVVSVGEDYSSNLEFFGPLPTRMKAILHTFMSIPHFIGLKKEIEDAKKQRADTKTEQTELQTKVVKNSNGKCPSIHGILLVLWTCGQDSRGWNIWSCLKKQLQKLSRNW